MSNSSATPTPPRRRVSRHAVRDHIARMVLTNQYAPGEKLVQQKLAKELGVSQGVVREALFELKGLGLVDTHDNRGGVVSPQCDTFLVEAMEIREVHEGLVARRCCTRITRAQVQELRELAHEIHRRSTTGQPTEASLLDRQLHLRLMEVSGSSLQIRMSNKYWFSVKIIRSDERDDQLVLQDHLAILAAIESGDGDQAEAAMRDHIRKYRVKMEEALKKSPGQIHWLIDPLEEEVVHSVEVRHEEGQDN